MPLGPPSKHCFKQALTKICAAICAIILTSLYLVRIKTSFPLDRARNPNIPARGNQHGTLRTSKPKNQVRVSRNLAPWTSEQTLPQTGHHKNMRRKMCNNLTFALSCSDQDFVPPGPCPKPQHPGPGEPPSNPSDLRASPNPARVSRNLAPWTSEQALPQTGPHTNMRRKRLRSP